MFQEDIKRVKIMSEIYPLLHCKFDFQLGGSTKANKS